jgi:hypothetical protein
MLYILSYIFALGILSYSFFSIRTLPPPAHGSRDRTVAAERHTKKLSHHSVVLLLFFLVVGDF